MINDAAVRLGLINNYAHLLTALRHKILFIWCSMLQEGTFYIDFFLCATVKRHFCKIVGCVHQLIFYFGSTGYRRKSIERAFLAGSCVAWCKFVEIFRETFTQWHKRCACKRPDCIWSPGLGRSI